MFDPRRNPDGGIPLLDSSARRFGLDRDGYPGRVTVLVIVLLVLALVFGVGAVLEGLAWLFLITLILLVAAGWFGWTKVRSAARR